MSGLLQAAALDVVTQPGWRTHLRVFREQLRTRRDLLLASLAAHAPAATVETVPQGGPGQPGSREPRGPASRDTQLSGGPSGR